MNQPDKDDPSQHPDPGILNMLESFPHLRLHYNRDYDPSFKFLDMIKCNEKTFDDTNFLTSLYVKYYFEDLRRLYEPVEVIPNWSPPMNDRRFKFGLGTMAEDQHELQKSRTFIFPSDIFILDNSDEKIDEMLEKLHECPNINHIFNKSMLIFPGIDEKGSYLTIVKNAASCMQYDHPIFGVITEPCEVFSVVTDKFQSYNERIVPKLISFLKKCAELYPVTPDYIFKESLITKTHCVVAKEQLYDDAMLMLLLVKECLAYPAPDTRDLDKLTKREGAANLIDMSNLKRDFAEKAKELARVKYPVKRHNLRKRSLTDENGFARAVRRV